MTTSGSESAHLSKTLSIYSFESEQNTSLARFAAFKPINPIPEYNSATITPSGIFFNTVGTIPLSNASKFAYKVCM